MISAGVLEKELIMKGARTGSNVCSYSVVNRRAVCYRELQNSARQIELKRELLLAMQSKARTLKLHMKRLRRSQKSKGKGDCLRFPLVVVVGDCGDMWVQLEEEGCTVVGGGLQVWS